MNNNENANNNEQDNIKNDNIKEEKNMISLIFIL